MKRIAVWLGAGLVVLSLVAVYVPREIALYYLTDELADEGLEFDGLETLDVGLFTGTVSLGPSHIAAGDVAYRIGRIEARLDLGALLNGRVHLKDVEIADTEVVTFWGTDGSLDAGVFELETAGPDDTDASEDDAPVEFGIDRLSVVRSVAILKDFTGLEIALRLERAKLDNFQTWTDISQGALLIEGDINDMPIGYDGTFHTDDSGLHLDLNGGLSGITPERIARLLGPDAAPRLSGTLGFDLNHDLHLAEDGSLTGQSHGAVTLEGLALEDDPVGSVALNAAQLQIELDHKIPTFAPFELQGEIGTELTGLGLVDGDGAELSLDRATSMLAGFHTREIGFDAETTVTFGERIASRVTVANTSIIDLMIDFAGATLRALISFDQEFDVVPSVTVEGIRLSRPANAELGAVEMAFAGGAIDFRQVEARYEQPRLSVGTGLTGNIGEGRLEVDGEQPTSVTFAGIDLTSDDIQLAADREREEVNFQLQVALNEITSAVGSDSTFVEAMNFSLTDTRVVESDAEEATATGRLDISAINPRSQMGENGQITTGERLAISFDLAEFTRAVREERFPAGRIAVEGWKVQQGDATTLGLSSARVAFGSMRLTDDGKRLVLGRAGKADTNGGRDTPVEARGPPATTDINTQVAPESSPIPVAARRPALAPIDSPEPRRPGDGRMVPDEVLISELEDEETESPDDPTETEIPDPGEPEVAASTERAASVLPADTGSLDKLPLGLEFEINDLVARPPGAGVDTTIGSVRGSLTSVTASAGGATNVSLSGSASVTGLRNSGVGRTSSIGNANLSFAEAVITDAGLSSLTDARGNFDSVATSMPAGAERTLSLAAQRAEMNIAELRMLEDAPRIVASISASGMQIEESGTAPHNAEVAELTMTGLDIQENGALSIADLRLAGLKANLTERIFEGSSNGDASSGAEVPSAPPSAPAVRIGQIAVAGPSRINYVDVFEGNPVSFAVDVNSATVGPFDSQRPELPTQFAISGTLDQRAPLEFSGHVRPNSSSANFSLRVDARRIPVATFSGYAQSIAGIVLDGGEATTSVDLTAENDRLGGKVQLSLQELNAHPASPADAAQFEEQYGITLADALALVERGPGRIEMTLPIGGTIDDVEIDWDDLIEVAIGNVVGGAVTGLMPWNWFTDDDRPETWEAVLEFDPGSAELNEQGVEFLIAAAEFLRTKPDAGVSLCGQSGTADLAVLREGEASTSDVTRDELSALHTLADARKSAVLAHLESVHGLGADRLGTCRIRVEDAPGTPPAALFVVGES